MTTMKVSRALNPWNRCSHPVTNWDGAQWIMQMRSYICIITENKVSWFNMNQSHSENTSVQTLWSSVCCWRLTQAENVKCTLCCFFFFFFFYPCVFEHLGLQRNFWGSSFINSPSHCLSGRWPVHQSHLSHHFQEDVQYAFLIFTTPPDIRWVLLLPVKPKAISCSSLGGWEP